MKFTETIIKTRKEKVKEADSINADLLIRGNYIDQLMAGVYTFLPLGLRVINNISAIIRDEMERMGGSEILMPSLQPKENWKKTDRWETEDNLFRFTSYYTKTDYALGATHEEVVMPLMKEYIQSYRDLPKYVFQIQNKFRDEKRAKAGLLRGREFLMKDFYSFHRDEKDLDAYYEKMKESYSRVFERCGIGDKTYVTFASGGSFSRFSHEFQTESDSGEDIVYLCEKCRVAINKEVISEQKVCPECRGKKLKEIKAIEVGNIFKNKTKYTRPFDVEYIDEKNIKHQVITGCYGIGVGRLMGAIVEISHDEKGIVWPKEVAPFQVHLVSLGEDKSIIDAAQGVYDELKRNKIEVLWDDRNESAGVKLSEADLVGLPIRLVVSQKTVKSKAVELKLRNKEKTELVTPSKVIKVVQDVINV
jgi:prolyl-tRNA synthetase